MTRNDAARPARTQPEALGCCGGTDRRTFPLILSTTLNTVSSSCTEPKFLSIRTLGFVSSIRVHGLGRDVRTL
jgi:hypothetical protein